MKKQVNMLSINQSRGKIVFALFLSFSLLMQPLSLGLEIMKINEAGLVEQGSDGAILPLAKIMVKSNFASAETCYDECVYQERKCTGDYTYQICGNFDTDSCLDWSSNYSCSNGSTCSLGQCVTGTTPTQTGVASIIVQPAGTAPLYAGTTFQLNVTANDTSTVGRISKICLTSSDISYSQCFTCSNTKSCSNNFSIYNSLPQTLVFYGKAYDTSSQVLATYQATINLIPIATTCTNECSVSGARECSGTGSYKICGNFDTDSCLEWSSLYNCASGYYCSSGSCVYNTPTCTNDCSYTGQRQCSSSGAYQICGNFDTDSCLEWSGNYSCSSSQTCVSGQCNDNAPVCSNECTYSGEKKCTGDGTYQTCGNYDQDSCLEWSNNYYCATNYTCSSGSCIYTPPTPTCTNDCSTSGERVCSGTGGYKICGNFDTDSCLEWSSIYNCSSGTACSNGQCITQCTSHSQKQCYDNDLYWYNSCGTKEEKSQECGSDTLTSQYQCSTDKNYVQRKKELKGCSNSACYTDYVWENTENCASQNKICQNNQCVDIYNPYETKKCNQGDVWWYDSNNQPKSQYQDCGASGWGSEYQCFAGNLQRKWYNRDCQGSSCTETSEWKTTQDCGDDELTNNYQCSGNTLQRQKIKKGCGYQTCYDYLVWENVQDCALSNQICQNNQCVTPTPTCSDECSYSGAKQCNSNGYQTCGQYDADTCLEWSNTTSCGTNQYCNNGQCVNNPPTCTNDCNYSGQRECSGNGYKECGQYDNDSCLDWSSIFSCSSNQYCSNGQCLDNPITCANDCNYTGQKECYGNNAIRECGNYDSDSCLDWQITYCASNYTCSNNSCQPINTCSDECNYSGEKVCSGNGYKTCGNYDNDSCLEWSAISNCSTNQYCSNGQCYNNTPTCNNECSYSGAKQCAGSGYQTCGNYDSDSCLEWSNINSCSNDTSCGYGNCNNNERPDWYCSGDGNCNYTCSYSSSCESGNDYLACYDNDVWWYHSNGNRYTLYRDCGNDYCDAWGNNYCSGNNVYQSRVCYHKGCSSNACYSTSYTETRLAQTCSAGTTCQNGQCQTSCECYSGACCDGCHYKTSGTVCNTETQTEYGCPWGLSCGADTASRVKTRSQYCTGYSSSCSGNWSESAYSGWTKVNDCSPSEVCSVGNATCSYSASCIAPDYYKHYYKGCWANALYWYDSNNVKNDKYKDCNDNNTCTIDSCSRSSCLNEEKCDGSTCEIGSTDYCATCEVCGDGVCNCGETVCSCSEDCKGVGLSISILAKPAEKRDDWKEELFIASGKEIDFLLVVANNSIDEVKNVSVIAALPSEISFKDDLKINGSNAIGNIEEGINFATLPAGAIETITFRGKATDLDERRTVEIVSQVKAENIASSDNLTIEIGSKGALGAAWLLWGSIKDLFGNWLFWILLVIALFILFLIFRNNIADWRARKKLAKAAAARANA